MATTTNKAIETYTHVRAHGPQTWVRATDPRTGVEFEVLATVVAGEYESPCGDGWHEPHDPGGFVEAEAWYFRPYRGWKRLNLTPAQEADLCEWLTERERRAAREW